MITREMVERGLLRKDILTFAEDSEGDPICQIGDNWLYFGGNRPGPEDPNEYLEGLSFGQMTDAVCDCLESLLESESPVDYEEYICCELFLRERDDEVKKPFVVDIEEINRMSVIVYADELEDAEDIVQKIYDNEGIDLSRNCFEGVRIIAYAANPKDLLTHDVCGEEV